MRNYLGKKSEYSSSMSKGKEKVLDDEDYGEVFNMEHSSQSNRSASKRKASSSKGEGEEEDTGTSKTKRGTEKDGPVILKDITEIIVLNLNAKYPDFKSFIRKIIEACVIGGYRMKLRRRFKSKVNEGSKKSIMKKSSSSSKKSLALKIVKKSRIIALRMKKSKQVEVGATSGFVSKGARMRVIPPREKFKFRFSLPSSDDEDDVELDEDDYIDRDSPVVIEDEDVELEESDYIHHDSPVAGVEDDDEAQLAFEESLLPQKEDKYSRLDDYTYDNYLFRL